MITRSEHIVTARGESTIVLHRHDSGTHSLGVSALLGRMSIDVHLTKADMLALSDACRRIAEGEDIEGYNDTIVHEQPEEAVR